jgi:thiamine-phosphate pyrophosphorylase
MTTASPSSGLLPALMGVLEGLKSSDTLPEGLMQGETGWLTSLMPDALAEPASATRPSNRREALTQTAAAGNLLGMLATAGEIPADAALQLQRALDDAAERIGGAIRRAQADRIHGLYVIIDPEVTGGRDPLEIARAAINGGARMLQLRDKLRDKGESLPLAMALQDLCERTGAILIVNDHADIAAAVGSAGVHVGQTDLPVAQARQVLAPYQVLGRSNREFEQLVESKEMGADHVAFGAIYATTSKGVARNPQGPERVREAKALAGSTPLVAIGGINLENVTPVVEAGADAICVTAAVGAAEEPEAAAARMTAAIEAAGGRV